MDLELLLIQIRRILQGLDTRPLADLIDSIHPADAVDALDQLSPDERAAFFQLAPPDTLALILQEMPTEKQLEALNAVGPDRLPAIVSEMFSDEAADLITQLPPDVAERVLAAMSKQDAGDVRKLLQYEEDTSGGLMATEFIAIREYATAEQALAYLRKKAPDTESAYYLYVVDADQRLVGVMSLRDLVIADLKRQVKDLMDTDVVSVHVETDQEEAARVFRKYGFLTLPVVDDENRLVGIITADDILDVVEEEATEDLFKLAGLAEEERVFSPVRQSVKKRLPWLFVNLLTAFMAAATVGLFQGTIAKVVALATFMPVVAGMGGNAGTQVLTIIVRGLALGELSVKQALRPLLKEAAVGLVNGAAIGTTVAAVGWLTVGKPIFGLVIGLAMVINLVAASVAGVLVPLGLKLFRIDPALASSVFVTTVTDVCGFFSFLGLATLFLRYLL